MISRPSAHLSAAPASIPSTQCAPLPGFPQGATSRVSRLLPLFANADSKPYACLGADLWHVHSSARCAAGVTAASLCPAQGCAELQMSAEALRQGYKVGYSDLGIDESKELALTLTSRGGLWASPKVDQLCQAKGSPITVAPNQQATTAVATRGSERVVERSVAGGAPIDAGRSVPWLEPGGSVSTAPDPDAHPKPCLFRQVIRGELRTAQRAHARKRKAALLYDAPLGARHLAACPEGRGMSQLRATTEDRKAQWMRVRLRRSNYPVLHAAFQLLLHCIPGIMTLRHSICVGNAELSRASLTVSIMRRSWQVRCLCSGLRTMHPTAS